MISDLCVAGIGEVLMDIFEDGEATVGGAPLNVVFHLNRLLCALANGEAVFLSAVGDDAWGHHIRSTLVAEAISTRYLAQVEQPTGSALVFEGDGGAGFEIMSNVAWDCIELDQSALELARRCDATIFGSLSQRSPVSRASIRQFVSRVNGHRLYDVNLRRNTRTGIAGYSAEIIEESLKLATMVKMNDSELEEVSAMLGWRAQSTDAQERAVSWMERLGDTFSLHTVAVTRGSRGALVFSEGRHLALPDSTFDQSLVHPVGAGDSFAAGLLFGVMQGWTPEHGLELANLISSFVVQHISATPPFSETLLKQTRNLAERASRSIALRVSS